MMFHRKFTPFVSRFVVLKSPSNVGASVILTVYITHIYATFPVAKPTTSQRSHVCFEFK